MTDAFDRAARRALTRLTHGDAGHPGRPAVWIDRDYDASAASDGASRYGAYLRDAVARDDHSPDDGPAAFGALAWRAATPPVMSPGYVRCHPLVLSARVHRSGWDGALLAAVTLATPPPAPLAALGGWHGWPTEPRGDAYGDTYVPVEPSEQQLGRADYLLTTAELCFALPVTLPDPPAATAPDLVAVAATVVGVLVGALDDHLAPVLAALDGA